MIVKNESKIITRLFDTLIDIIDCFCICDTGSTDDTINIINNYFAKHNKPGIVVTEPFKNFCHNRNVALNSCLGMSDFILLIDADMILEIGKSFNKSELLNGDYDSFNILQGSDTFFYQNVRIIRNNGKYSYTGVTHEYMNTPNGNRSLSLNRNQLFIKDVGDGGSKSNKFERDISLLLDGIKNEPNNVRYYFYLANSYHDSGRYGEAINCYKKRIQLGGWNEEIWYSHYRTGLCYMHMDKIKEAIYCWMEGFDYYPERLEGVYEIIKHYRINSKHKLAHLFYKEAKKILDKNCKRTDYLFLHDDIYTSRIYYEYSVFAAYVGIKNINDEVVIILNNSKNEQENNNLLQNIKFYKQVLEPNHVIDLSEKYIATISNEQITFNSSSSCLIPKSTPDDGYHLNIRFVNYNIDSGGNYHNCDKHIISINKYISLNKNLTIVDGSSVFADLKYEDRRYIGIEDIRIYCSPFTIKDTPVGPLTVPFCSDSIRDSGNNSDVIKFIGTGYHVNNKIGIVTGLYNIKSGNDVTLTDVVEMKQTFNNSSCEKNWVFVEYKNSTHIVYDWHPLRLCAFNDAGDEIHVIDTKQMPRIFSYVRGSTCGFMYNTCDEIWFVVHMVSYEKPRHYYHMIAVFDKNMNLLRYSAPFKFTNEPIEYCLSIVVENGIVIINYSTWDRTTKIAIYDKSYIDAIIKYKACVE